MDKLETPVDFPLEGLDLAPYCIEPHATATYSLAAVSNHFGGTGGGHYTAHARSGANGRWYEFDDSTVTETTGGPRAGLDPAAAYVLFYVRDDLRPACWKDGSGDSSVGGSRSDSGGKKEDSE